MLDLAARRWLKQWIVRVGRRVRVAEHDDPAEAAARLEQALERIARNARAPQPPASQANTAEIAARLDGLIAELREALVGPAGA